MRRLILLILSTVFPFFLTAQVTSGKGFDLAVMTYNIRFNNPDDGPNAWPNRKQAVINLITSYQPDILGVQEALIDQINDIDSEYEDYSWFGVGRDNGKEKGEYCAIFYRNDKFEFLDGNTFWLSQTPQVPGSMGWDAACPRVVTWVKLQDKGSGSVFFHFNTHFDHMGNTARLESARLLKDNIRQIAGNAPVAVTGDFNLRESEEPYGILTRLSEDYFLSDTRHLAPNPTGPDYTYMGFDFIGESGEIIDYIFCRNTKRIKSHQIITDNTNGIYPSDHLPVISILILP